jgi:hypothetical protein
MAPAAGDKKRRQAILAASLFAVVVALAIWDLHGTTRTPSHVPQARVDASRTQHASGKKAGTSALPSSFHLQLERLARSEGIDYAGDGHNLFGGAPAPVAIEKPIAPARPIPVILPPVLAKTEVPIDVKYAGYAESEPGKMNGLFMRGDDISVARTGDIIFHRFRVGPIQSTNAQLTDLASNHSQRVTVATGK